MKEAGELDAQATLLVGACTASVSDQACMQADILTSTAA